MSLSSKTDVDPELKDLIDEAIAAELLKPGTEDAVIAGLVARSGQGRLTADQRLVWEKRVLPILSKPLSDQIAVSAILRRGGRLAPSRRP